MYNNSINLVVIWIVIWMIVFLILNCSDPRLSEMVLGLCGQVLVEGLRDAGVNSVRRYQGLPHVRQSQLHLDPKMDPLLAKAEPISIVRGTSVIE